MKLLNSIYIYVICIIYIISQHIDVNRYPKLYIRHSQIT